MNPHRIRDNGTAALEAGVRLPPRSPAKQQPPAEAEQAKSAATLPFQSAHLRQKVSKFGGMIMESNSVAIPQQSWEASSPTSIMAHPTSSGFEGRHEPTQSNVYAGIPGYMGYKPHASHPQVIGHSASPAPHARLTSALDTSKQPYIMPVVGYSGHIRGLADADKNYGTTHWKNSGFVNESHKPAASRPWDGRDVAGRPFGGATPGDFGTYEADPEWEQKKRDADEANEILELRSMGIRALLKKSPELGGSR